MHGDAGILIPDRRDILKGALGLAALPLIGRTPAAARFKADPFSLGVASGDPAPDGFVLWTRLAPEPLLQNGGMRVPPVEVVWEVAKDDAVKEVVRSGKTMAYVEVGHSVHVEVDGLEPGRDYFYRFRADDVQSPIGRVRTLPAPGATLEQVRFGVAGCQAWEGGYYTAWRRLAEENFDFVFHYGDYIYEYAAFTSTPRIPNPPRVMPQSFGTCLTLSDYRRRYSLYKSDRDLQAAHASCAFMPSFDDHEVVDNWAADQTPRGTPSELFLFRRAAAFQAWYEHMPVRRAALPRGPDVLAHRAFRLGSLIDLAILDTRQYRTRQPCGDGFKARCAEADDPSRTMLGEAQERWLGDLLRASKTTWQVLAQQVLFGGLDVRAFPWVEARDVPASDLDSWDGAPKARERVLDMLAAGEGRNAVVLSGDMHTHFAIDIKRTGVDDKAPPLGVEFMTTSISSFDDGREMPEHGPGLLQDNPHLKFVGGERGYTRHTVTPTHWRTDFRAVPRISVPDEPAVTRKSFAVEAGKPGLQNG
jgi:alkaline phosphatase D